jgi:predicted enzyme related to lactoylglutathione lyase
MADKTARGRFVWHELMTPDTAAAHAFYGKTLGWKSQPWEQDPSYSMFAASSGPLGGAVSSTQGPSHWMPYLGTTDIEATVRDVTRLGGSVKKEITDMPNGSKYAVLADPQGAVFGVYWSAQPAGKETPPKRGEYSWHELTTTDPKAAFSFYSTVFGWENAGEHQMGPDAVYYMFGRNGAPLGGLWKSENPASWLGYVRVKDVHQTAKKVTSSGGRVINGPMEVPGGDWIVQCTDPSGAMFAAHTLAADLAKPAEAAAAPAAAAPAQAAAAPAAKPAAAAKGGVKKAAARKPAKKAAKKAAKKPAKRAARKAARKSAKKAGIVRRAAAKAGRGARKASRKVARKVSKKTRSGGKKKAAKKPRKGK